MRVVQYCGKTWGKGSLRTERIREKVWDWVVAYASRRGGDWLVVLPKDAEIALRKAGVVPPFIHLEHFGSLRGLDAYCNVDGVIIVGRPMPPPTDAERLAGIVRGTAVEHTVDGWYPSETVLLCARDGTRATVEADRHPDQFAEAIRSSIAEAELLQAIGRVRGVNRTTRNPVEVVLLGNVPVPGLELDSVRQKGPQLRNHGEVMAANR